MLQNLTHILPCMCRNIYLDIDTNCDTNCATKHSIVLVFDFGVGDLVGGIDGFYSCKLFASKGIMKN